MKKHPQLFRVFLFRSMLRAASNTLLEYDLNILIAIKMMESTQDRVTVNSLLNFLSNHHRTPRKKNLILRLKKLNEQEMIRLVPRSRGDSVRLQVYGENHLCELEQQLKLFKR